MKPIVGLYEQVVSEVVGEAIADARGEGLDVVLRSLDSGDSHSYLAQYLAPMISSALRSLPQPERTSKQIELVNKILLLLAEDVPESANEMGKILAGLGVWTLEEQREVREGVVFVQNLPADLFFITLNKTDRDYSPTTMYDDYAVSEHMFHWQSQSTVSEDSPTGQRYINHRQRGSEVLLFVREDKRNNGSSCPYTFLGPGDYCGHQGSRPMSILWRLRHRMPARLLRKVRRLASD